MLAPTTGHPRLDDPLYAQRNPFQTFLLGFGVAASVPLVRGESGSALLEAELSDLAVILWGTALLLGSILGLLGMVWPRHPDTRAWTGLVIERTGLLLVGGVGAVYALAVFQSVDDKADVAYIVGVQSAFVGACLWRVIQISRRMRWWRRVTSWLEQHPEQP